MKVSFKWLKEYFDKDLDINEICERLTISGTKVETIESNKIEVTNVVCGLIEEIKLHPDAEKLVVCKVNIGDSYVQIVTGAKNMKEGDIVPVALHGAVLSKGLKIKKGKLRGVESQGMMCSEEELGLVDHADGLMILPKDTKVGENIVDALDTGDEVIEFEITSNRPDCLGVLGIAREVKALYDIDMKEVKTTFKTSGDNIKDYISAEVLSPNCRRYEGRIIKNIKVCDSPKFIQERLIASGVRPINNIVDLTNYVMLETSQPMHAFDYDKINGKKIIVSDALDGEKLLTLDGSERVLDNTMLTIRDSEKALALGGIMGGEESKVNSDTKMIFVESGNFRFSNVRNTSKKLGLRTDSSLRFEKDIDDNLAIFALDRFCALIEEFSYGEIVDGTIDIVKESYERKEIEVSVSYINNFLKTYIPKDRIIKILENLSIDVLDKGDNLLLTPSTFRRDLFIKEDIAEEIARIYGYDNIREEELDGSFGSIGKTTKQKFEDKVIDTMIALGFGQSISYSFYSKKVFDKLNLPEDHELRERAIAIRNPLGEDYSIMRGITLPCMLDALSRNLSYSNQRARIFDIGKTYLRNGDSFDESNVLTLGMYGEGVNYFTLKGVVEALFSSLNITFMLERETEVFYHPGRGARIVLGKNVLGRFGSVHPYVLDNYDISRDIFVGEFYLDKIFNIFKPEKKYKKIPKYPSITFDLNVVVDDNVLSQDIEKIIRSKGGNILESLEIFDVYKGPQIKDNKKSISYSIIFRDKTKTLNDSEINKVIDKILVDLNNKLGAELRQ